MKFTREGNVLVLENNGKTAHIVPTGERETDSAWGGASYPWWLIKETQEMVAGPTGLRAAIRTARAFLGEEP